MTIEQEIELAKKDWRQSMWDRILVTAFYKTPYKRMNDLRWCFKNTTGEPFESLTDLKRTSTPLQKDATVVRFVSGYLPKLADVLWTKDVGCVERVVAALARSSIDTAPVPADMHKLRTDGAAFRRAAKDAFSEKASHALVRQQRADSSRSNWKAHKKCG